MTSLTSKTIAKAYLMIVLALAMLFSPWPQLFIALVLVVLQVYTLYRPPRDDLSFLSVVFTLVLTPLALEPLAGGLFSVLLSVPAVYLLDQSLRDNASNQPLACAKAGRSATAVLKAFATAVLLVFAASLVLLNQVLMLTTAVLIGYFAMVLAYVFRKVPRMPLEESKTWSRVVVGDTVRNTVHFR